MKIRAGGECESTSSKLSVLHHRTKCRSGGSAWSTLGCAFSTQSLTACGSHQCWVCWHRRPCQRGQPGRGLLFLSCFSLLQNLSTQMDIRFVSSFLHLCFFLLPIDFNGDIFFLFFMMVICLFYAMLKQMLFHQVRDPFCNCQGYGVVQCQWKSSELQI